MNPPRSDREVSVGAPTGRGPASGRKEREQRAVHGSFGAGVETAARWTARGIILVVGLVILWYIARALWSVLFPALLTLLLSSVLWPVNRLARRILPKGLAALVTILGLLLILTGIGALIVPTLTSDIDNLIERARTTLAGLDAFLAAPPFNLADSDLNALLDAGLVQLREQAGNILSGIRSGVGIVTSGIVIVLLVIVFVFFCLKDGDRFLPWLRQWTKPGVFRHAAELSDRAWATLSGYMTAQATVALVDAVLIGLGLWLLNVPLVFPLALITFFAAFVPIVGAVTSGLLAALVALVANGWQSALLVLALVLVVQQVESNALQPVLVGRTLRLHPVIVLGSVTVAGTLFGIVGALLAAPITAVCVVVLRYIRDATLAPPVTEPATTVNNPDPVHRGAEVWESQGGAPPDGVPKRPEDEK